MLKTCKTFLAGMIAIHSHPSLAQVSTAKPRSCETVPAIQKQLAEAIAGAVRGRNYSDIDRVVSRSFGVQSAASGARDTAMLSLVRWSEESRNLSSRDSCLEKDRSSFRYDNALTGQVDELRLTFNDGRLVKVRVLTAVSPRPGRKLPDSGAARQLGDYVQGLTDEGLFSGVVLVGRNGKPIYAQAFGLADHASGKANQADSLFNLASLNKIFTATAVMQLIEAGRLSLDARLGDILPDEVKGTAAADIQIKFLLSHTSGLMDSYEKLRFQPGSSFAYSNMGFGVLGKVIEAVSHLKYEDYIRLHITGPAGMARTDIYQASRPVAELTTGYMPKLVDGELRWVANPLLQTWPGNSIGGFWSSAPDLFKFAEALRTGRLLTKSNVAMMRATKSELGAPEYGFGVIRWRGPGIWGHAGDLPGTSADLEMHCDDGTVIIVLSNRDTSTSPVIAKARQLFFRGNCSLP